jgi:hypothetical protein
METEFKESSESLAEGEDEICRIRCQDSSGSNSQDYNSLVNTIIAKERRKMLQDQFCALARCPSRGHDCNRVLQDAIAHASFGSIWDTSHPFAAALCKPFT